MKYWLIALMTVMFSCFVYGVPEGGLVFYDFDGDAIDSWNGLNGTITQAGSVGFSSNYATFNQTDDGSPLAAHFNNTGFIAMPSSIEAEIAGAGIFSVTFWMNSSEDDRCYPFSIFTSDVLMYIELQADGDIRYRQYSGASYQIDTTITGDFVDSEYHQFAYTYNGTHGLFYIDGILNSTDGGGLGGVDDRGIQVGSSEASFDDTFLCEFTQIDHFQLFNKTLSPEEVKKYYNHGDIDWSPSFDINNDWNMTSDGGCTDWRVNKNNACTTSDTTPSVTFTTSMDGNCSIGLLNYPGYNSSRRCAATGSASHNCTLYNDDALTEEGNYDLFIQCNSTNTAESDLSGALALDVDLDPALIGSGVPGDCYELWSCANFEQIRFDTSACYELGADIDCAGYGIGGNGFGNFDGDLDGNEKVLSNARITGNCGTAADAGGAGNLTGLFRLFGSGASIHHILIYNFTIDCPGTENGNIGLLSGASTNRDNINIYQVGFRNNTIKGKARMHLVSGLMNVGGTPNDGHNYTDIYAYDNIQNITNASDSSFLKLGGVLGGDLENSRIDRVWSQVITDKSTSTETDFTCHIASSSLDASTIYLDSFYDSSACSFSNGGNPQNHSAMLDPSADIWSNFSTDWFFDAGHYPVLSWEEPRLPIPEILSPGDYSTLDENATMNVTFNAADTDNAVLSCRLIVDGNDVNVTNSSYTQGTNFTFRYDPPANGTYDYYVECRDIYNVRESDVYEFSLGTVYIPVPINETISVGICPSDTPTSIMFFAFLAMTIFLIWSGYVYNRTMFGFFGSLLLMTLSWVMIGCFKISGIIILFFSIFLIVYFVFRRT